MTDTYDKENHWYGWNGGECPVHPETKIEAAFAAVVETTIDVAGGFTWEHLNDRLSDIIAFRITKLYREPGKPREWWVNFYETHHGIFDSKMDADVFSKRIECVHVREVLPEEEA